MVRGQHIHTKQVQYVCHAKEKLFSRHEFDIPCPPNWQQTGLGTSYHRDPRGLSSTSLLYVPQQQKKTVGERWPEEGLRQKRKKKKDAMTLGIPISLTAPIYALFFVNRELPTHTHTHTYAHGTKFIDTRATLRSLFRFLPNSNSKITFLKTRTPTV